MEGERCLALECTFATLPVVVGLERVHGAGGVALALEHDEVMVAGRAVVGSLQTAGAVRLAGNTSTFLAVCNTQQHEYNLQHARDKQQKRVTC